MNMLARRPALLLLPLLVLYLGIAMVVTPSATPVDEMDYLQLATNLTHGDYAYSGTAHATAGAWAREPNLWFGPGLPATIAPLVALHVPVAAIRLIGPLFLFLAVLLFYCLLRLYAPTRWSLAGAALLGLYYPFYTLFGNLRSEPLAILLVVAAMYFLAGSFRTGKRRGLLLAGFALGYLAMTRVAYGWALIALLAVAGAVALIRRRSLWARRTAGVAAVALVVCVPWLAYTYSLSGRVLYWGNSGGSSLYWMASPYPGETGEWHSPTAVLDDPRYAAHRPFLTSIATLPSLERDRALQDKAVEFIRQDPQAYAKHVVQNTARIFVGVPQSFEPVRLRPLALHGFPNLCLLLAVIAAVVVRVKRRLHLPPEAIALSLLALLGLGVHVLLAGYTRMLFPTIPLLLWFVITSAVSAREGRAVRVAEVARPPGSHLSVA